MLGFGKRCYFGTCVIAWMQGSVRLGIMQPHPSTPPPPLLCCCHNLGSYRVRTGCLSLSLQQQLSWFPVITEQQKLSCAMNGPEVQARAPHSAGPHYHMVELLP